MCMNEELKTALTPALSPWRGRNLRRVEVDTVRQELDSSLVSSRTGNERGDNRTTSKNAPVALPLPGGEGRGEGELIPH